MGVRDTLQEALGSRLGYTLERTDRIQLLEAADFERRQLQKDLDLLAYTALDYSGGNPQELKPEERRSLAQRSRVVWMKDPQAGASIDLMNDFVFGRGIPKPKANDPLVQEKIDEAWDDPDNQLVLTSYAAQLAVGTDLTLQSNVFFLVFDDGDDGKVKLGLLNHDDVQTVVRDPDNRLRVLYYVAKHFVQEWDYDKDMPKVDVKGVMIGKSQVRYYEHWRNVQDAIEDAKSGARDQPDLAPKAKMGDGKVFHLAINRGSEMAFGHPTMDRLLRWYNSYNSFMDARVDIMSASAAFVMKRKIKGTPTQLGKMATQALSRRSALGSAGMVQDAPKPASILEENDSVSHEDFNINTNAPAAAQDAQMLRAMISAGTRWPQSYYGDASQSTLATATSLELPVLKAVENRQEVVESLVRFFVDRVIERAVETKQIPEELTPEEVAKLQSELPGGETPYEDPANAQSATGDTNLAASYEEQSDDEKATQRDLGYEFSMPSPLRRMMGDLVLAIMNIAKTFDPNNTNVELGRVLLNVALGEGLELEDPAKAVEKILPEGYVDPAVQAAQDAQQQQMAGGQGQFGDYSPAAATEVPGADGQMHSNENPYGAVTGATQMAQALVEAATEILRRGGGATVPPPAVQRVLKQRGDDLADMMATELGGLKIVN